MKAFPKDIDVANLKERHIGVESELWVKTDSYQEVGHFEHRLKENWLLQSVGFDGGGREFRTNPIRIKSLLKQVTGRKYLTLYYAHLKNHTEVTESGGTHIHISILDGDHKNMESNAFALSTVFYEQFQKIAGRKTNWARKDGAGLKTIDDCKKYCDDREREAGSRVYYMKGSMLGPTSHKTLEFRGPKGSNDVNEILAWVDFLNNVVKAANHKSIDGVKFGDLVKTDVIAAYIKDLPRGRRLTKRDLNKTVNAGKLS